MHDNERIAKKWSPTARTESVAVNNLEHMHDNERIAKKLSPTARTESVAVNNLETRNLKTELSHSNATLRSVYLFIQQGMLHVGLYMMIWQSLPLSIISQWILSQTCFTGETFRLIAGPLILVIFCFWRWWAWWTRSWSFWKLKSWATTPSNHDNKQCNTLSQ